MDILILKAPITTGAIGIIVFPILFPDKVSLYNSYKTSPCKDWLYLKRRMTKSDNFLHFKDFLWQIQKMKFWWPWTCRKKKKKRIFDIFTSHIFHPVNFQILVILMPKHDDFLHFRRLSKIKGFRRLRKSRKIDICFAGLIILYIRCLIL